MASQIRFRFTNELPDDQLFSDIGALNGLNGAQIDHFVQILLSFLLDRIDLGSQVTEFAKANGISNINALKGIVRGLMTFFKAALRQNLAPNYVKEDLVALGVTEDRATVVAGKWKAAFIELSRTVISQTLSVNELLDMDWKFGVTAASSELSQVSATFLQLRLVLNKGNKVESVQMELTLPQFYEFLHQMERAKQNLDILR